MNEPVMVCPSCGASVVPEVVPLGSGRVCECPECGVGASVPAWESREAAQARADAEPDEWRTRPPLGG